MHELSIVINILEIAEENAKTLHAKIIHEIEMDIGALSGVDYEALEFAMEHAPKNEMLKNTKLLINKIPAKARCNSCQSEFEVSDFYTPCPTCHQFDHDIFQGKELKVKSIKVD
jgi:hydrogenase nickel incorporation protein HypA/HybF